MREPHRVSLIPSSRSIGTAIEGLLFVWLNPTRNDLKNRVPSEARALDACYTKRQFMKRRAIPSAVLALCLAARAHSQTVAPLAIVDVNVVDVVKGEIRTHQTVLIAGGRIAAAGSSDSATIPAQAVRIPGEGRYLIPGLWDMHIHLRSDMRKPDVPLVDANAALLDLFLPNGVVGVREMGGDLADSASAGAMRSIPANAPGLAS